MLAQEAALHISCDCHTRASRIADPRHFLGEEDAALWPSRDHRQGQALNQQLGANTMPGPNLWCVGPEIQTPLSWASNLHPPLCVLVSLTALCHHDFFQVAPGCGDHRSALKHPGDELTEESHK